MYHLTEVDFTFVVESFLDDVTQFYATHEKFKCNVGLEASTCIILRKLTLLSLLNRFKMTSSRQCLVMLLPVMIKR